MSSYPPGCNSVPGDDEIVTKEGEAVYALLAGVDIDDEIADQVVDIVNNLVLSQGCPKCENEYEQQLEREVEEFYQQQQKDRGELYEP